MCKYNSILSTESDFPLHKLIEKKIFFLILMLFFSSNVYSSEATNFNPNLLINITDITKAFQITISMNDEHFTKNEDIYSEELKNYHQIYFFSNTEGFHMQNVLTVAEKTSEAQRYFNEFQAGHVDKLETQFTLRMEKEKYGSNGRVHFYHIYSSDKQPVGNFLIIISNNKVYNLTNVGIHFESFTEFQDIFSSKLKAIFNYNPIINK